MEEELYSSVNNPLPAYDLLDAIYGIQAKGIVKFWVKDDSEMTALVDPLLKVNNITLNYPIEHIPLFRKFKFVSLWDGPSCDIHYNNFSAIFWIKHKGTLRL